MFEYVVGFLILLGALIFVHEFGHFIVAKLVGVKVLKFSLGFPPAMINRKWGETEYILGWIPLGGYVKLLGEDPESDEEIPPEEIPRAFTSKSLPSADGRYTGWSAVQLSAGDSADLRSICGGLACSC